MSSIEESGTSLNTILSSEVENKVIGLLEDGAKDTNLIMELIMPLLRSYSAASARRNNKTYSGAEGSYGDFNACFSKAMEKALTIIQSPDTRPDEFFNLLTHSLKNQMTDVRRKVDRTLRRFPCSIDQKNESGWSYAELTPARQETRTEHSEEMILILDAARKILSTAQFELLELRLNNPSLTYDDIAKSFKEPIGTVKARSARLRGALTKNASFVDLVEVHLRPSLTDITQDSQCQAR